MKKLVQITNDPYGGSKLRSDIAFSRGIASSCGEYRL